MWLCPLLANAATRYSFSGKVSARPAYHLREPLNVDSERLGAQFEQVAEYSKHFKGVLGFGAWGEPVYSQYADRYPSDVNKYDSYDLRMRDIYLQYQTRNFFLRAGAQQVVWGETFGQFYSDIVNPKDYRDGLFGDISESRLTVPMLNTKFIFTKTSVQGILIPKPFFSVLPMPGSDYAFPFEQYLPSSAVHINRQTDLPMTQENAECGGRVTEEIGGYDFSAYYFNYYDRLPYYTLSPDAVLPQSIVLNEQHGQVQTTGLSMTKEWNGYVVRAEALRTQGRKVPILAWNAIGVDQVNNDIYVLAMDTPTFGRTNFSLQWSEDILDENPTGLLRPRVQSFASIRLQRPFFQDHELELIYIFSLSDHGQRIQMKYGFPLSHSLDLKLGVDWLEGPRDSEFGHIEKASRAFMLLAYFFKG